MIHDETTVAINLVAQPYPVVIRYEEEKKTIQLKGVSVQKNDKLENELASIAMKTIYR